MGFWDFALIGLYLVFAVAVGSFFTRKAGRGIESFFVGDRRLPWWIAGTSMVATTFAADTPLLVTQIVREGELSTDFYVVVDGSVRVTRKQTAADAVKAAARGDAASAAGGPPSGQGAPRFFASASRRSTTPPRHSSKGTDGLHIRHLVPQKYRKVRRNPWC